MASNPARGEATLKIGAGEYVLVATMESLSQVSAAIGDPPFSELFTRLMGGSIQATRTALMVFVQSAKIGDDKTLKSAEARRAAVAAYTLADLTAVQVAMQTLFEPLLAGPSRSDDSGNGTTAPA